MKEIRVEDAVGQVLCHDVTQIVRGVTKGATAKNFYVNATEGENSSRQNGNPDRRLVHQTRKNTRRLPFGVRL